MHTTAGSLALVDAPQPPRCLGGRAPARRRARDPRQDQPQRVGQLPLHAFGQRLERARRPDPQSLRARPQPLRLEFRLGRGRRRQPVRRRGRHRDRRLDRLPVVDERHRRHQADRRPDRRRAASCPSPTARTPPARWRAPCADAALLLAAMADAARTRQPDYTQIPRRRRPAGRPHRRGAQILRHHRRRRPPDGELPRRDEAPGRRARRPRRPPHPRQVSATPNSTCCSTSSRPTSTLTWRRGPDAPVHSLADVIAFNEQHRAEEMPFFGQEIFEKAQTKGPLTDRPTARRSPPTSGSRAPRASTPC